MKIFQVSLKRFNGSTVFGYYHNLETAVDDIYEQFEFGFIGEDARGSFEYDEPQDKFTGYFSHIGFFEATHIEVK